jgi:hypothetical protein
LRRYTVKYYASFAREQRALDACRGWGGAGSTRFDRVWCQRLV